MKKSFFLWKSFESVRWLKKSVALENSINTEVHGILFKKKTLFYPFPWRPNQHWLDWPLPVARADLRNQRKPKKVLKSVIRVTIWPSCLDHCHWPWHDTHPSVNFSFESILLIKKFMSGKKPKDTDISLLLLFYFLQVPVVDVYIW